MSPQINIFEQSDEVMTLGVNVRGEVIKLLTEALMLKTTLFQICRKELGALENRFNESYTQFVEYDDKASAFLLNAAKNESDLPNIRHFLEKSSLSIERQREGLRLLLHDTGNILTSNRTQGINYTAIQIALIAFLASILLGIVSIYVASLSEPIIVYPVKY